MPEPRRNSTNKRNSSNGRQQSGGASSGKGGRRNGGMSVRDAVSVVREEFPALLGRPVESVLGVERDDDDNWQVTVQVVELARIPNSTDVLGAYAVTLDGDGEMIGYRRRRRYNRSQADEDQ